MGAEQAKARYDMKHVVANDETAKYYHYIQIFPKLPQDKGDFAEAQLSLYRANNLPARIWYRQANGNEITWNFTELQIDVNIPLQWFSPDTPDGWRVERVPAPGAAAAVNPKVRN
jgi:outer membrane lipoprotein-sorting protein